MEMSRCSIPTTLALASLCLATTVSCNRGPATIKQPTINASSAGKLAMEQYDKDGDGKVAGAELDRAPGLKAALKNLDTNGDGGVSADEVTARVNAWKVMETGTTFVQCRVTLDGQALGGAKVTFEPESFLGDAIKTALGTTTMYGDANMAIRPEDRQSPNDPGGVHLGLYKVRVSKIENGKEVVPARYNTDTILGQEVSYDDPGVKARNMQFALKSGN
jgi:EF hand